MASRCLAMFWRVRERSNSGAEPRARSLFASYFLTLSVAAALPLLVGVSIEGYVSFVARQRADSELRRLEAAQAANELEGFFRQLTALLADVGKQSFTDGASIATSERASEYRRLFALFRPLLRVTWVDGKQRDVIRLDRREVDELNGTAPTVHGELANTVRATRALSYKVQNRVGGRQSTMLVAAPGSVADGDVLVLEFDLRFLSEMLAKLHFANGGFVFVTDEAGYIIGHENANLALRRVKFVDPTRLSGIEAAPTDVPSVVSADSRIAFSGYKLKAPSWIVFAAQPERIATAWVSDTLWRLAILLGATLLLAAMFAAWSARRMARPISALTESARDLMLGQSINVHTQSGHRELQQLASQFSQMAVRVNEAQTGLEQKVQEKTRDLAAANQELEIASRHKDEFLAHMSHELRTPLNAVIGFSDLLKAQYFGPLNQKQSEYVRDINASGQHLLSLINDILDLAKVEAGRMELMLSDAHVAALIESCVALVSERINRSEQTLKVDVASDVSVWPLDERKIKQCLLNLLSNASKFTPAAGIIALRVWVENHALLIAVSDNGVGIAADDMPKLFSEFYQATAGNSLGNSQQREGTGLGLALTKGFVELHGGTIVVESAVGKGSTFTIRLPALAAADAVNTVTTVTANAGAAQ